MRNEHRNCYTVKSPNCAPRAAWSLKHAKAVAKEVVHWLGGVARVYDMDGKCIGTASTRNGRTTFRMS